jgi:predicted glutamine amidotransferase
MCFILTAIKLQENEEAKNAILSILKEKQAMNPHGTASVCFDDKATEIKRGLFDNWSDMKKTLDIFTITNYHFRQATIGKKNLKNVHFWKIGNWIFCHNGHIDAMGNEIESDSLVFFKSLIKKNYLTKDNQLKGKSIKEYVNTKDFWGRFLIINSKTKNIYFFGDYELYLVNKSYLVFTSTSVNFENKLDVMGLEFDIGESIETLDSKIDGIWMLNYKTQKFMQIFETFKDYSWGAYGYGGNKSRAREHNHSATFNFEEKDNMNRNEVLASKIIEKQEKKERSDASYIKEFYGRFSDLIKKKPQIADVIQEEYEVSGINIWGRTETEQHYWDKWITPKLPKGKNISFDDVPSGTNMLEIME